jgi:hypothetical protein
MAQNKTSPSERIATSFKKLAASSNHLKLATSELGKTISTLDVALNSLNVGVSAWHKIAGSDDDSFWSREIGYTQVGKRWGIALKRASGCHHENAYEEEVWLFADAPPWMAIESAGKIPDVFDELHHRYQQTIAKIQARTGEAEAFAIAVNAAKAELDEGR